jgi:LytS/YehU family sensor histidine kinase
MRLSLNHSRTPSVSLDDELKLLKKYIDLEKRRLSDAFNLDWQSLDDPSVLTVQVPTLLLQPFVENAILHGLLPQNKEKERILSVFVKKEDIAICCIISDNGVGRPKELQTSQSMGLVLTQERITLFNEIHKTNITWMIKDLVNTEGVACGTSVVIWIPIL